MLISKIYVLFFFVAVLGYAGQKTLLHLLKESCAFHNHRLHTWTIHLNMPKSAQFSHPFLTSRPTTIFFATPKKCSSSFSLILVPNFETPILNCLKEKSVCFFIPFFLLPIFTTWDIFKIRYTNDFLGTAENRESRTLVMIRISGKLVENADFQTLSWRTEFSSSWRA